MADLRTRIQQQPNIQDENIQAPPADDTGNTLEKTLQTPEAQKYLDQLHSLSEDPQYSGAVPEETKKSLQDAINSAKQAYHEQVSRNEWLDVAQTLGRALTQFGAAQRGSATGRDMSNLNFGQPIDYNAKSERSLKEYGMDVGAAEKMAELERQNRLQNKDEYNRKAGYLEAGLRTAQQGTAEQRRQQEFADQMKLHKDIEARKIQSEYDRADRAEKAADARQKNIQTAMDVKDIDGQIRDDQKKLDSMKTLFNNDTIAKDLSNKSEDKIKEKYGSIAAQAGISLSDLQEELKKTDTPGTFWDDENPKARQAIINNKVAEATNHLEALKRIKEQRSGRQPASQAAAPQQQSQQDPKVQDYADQYFSGDYNKAKQVLIGRGYKPAE